MQTPGAPSNCDSTLVTSSLVTASGVSWSAILAGATVAASLSLILLILGVGLGLSSVSPWAQDGVSAGTFGISSIAWITFMSLMASAVGGYIAGRLRTRWVGVHTDEVFFRDTAHGLLAWGVATLVTAALLTSVTGALLGTGMKAGANVVSGMASTTTSVASNMASSDDGDSAGDKGALSYFVDSLFRRDFSQTATPAQTNTNSNSPDTDEAQNADNQADTDTPAESTADVEMAAPTNTPMVPETNASKIDPAALAEAGRIFMYSMWREENLPAEDVSYLGQLVAQQTGLTQAEAEQRVTDIFTQMKNRMGEMEAAAKEAADEARETSAYASLWFFISLLIGAFVASLAATFGGRQRDL